MAGRKPDYRLVYVEENKGRKTYFRIGAGWKNTNGEAHSVGTVPVVGRRGWRVESSFYDKPVSRQERRTPPRKPQTAR